METYSGLGVKADSLRRSKGKAGVLAVGVAAAVLLLLVAGVVGRASAAGTSVTFTETGLPAGTPWSVDLGGTVQSSTTASISFTEAPGAYSYHIERRAAYAATPDHGTLVVGASAVSVAVTFSPIGQSSSIVSDFNGTSIAGGDWIWFNAILKPKSSIPSAGVQIRVVAQSISFGTGSSTTVLSVPDAKITYRSTAGLGTTHYSAAQDRWLTAVPVKFTDNVFFAGLAYQVPSGGLPGGIKDVNWTASFSSTSSGFQVQWQWAAAVYTNFTVDYNQLEVKPLHSTSLDHYPNGDQAGTPEAYTAYVVGGARGGGGSNFTGSLSGTASVVLPKD